MSLKCSSWSGGTESADGQKKNRADPQSRIWQSPTDSAADPLAEPNDHNRVGAGI